jgi:uncharacterized protein YdcH (DUF465 family)
MSNEVIERLTRIETHTQTLLQRFDKLDDRVSAVEKKQWMHSGGVAAIAFILSKFGIPH